MGSVPYDYTVQSIDERVERSPATRSPLLKALYATLGLVLLGVGIIGFFVPGLPGTPLLLVAAWLFSLSSERLYRWTTTNRWFGQSVANYHAGLGIPRRTKIIATTMVVIVISISVFVALDSVWLQVLVGGLGLYGIYFILTRPTTEDVLDAG